MPLSGVELLSDAHRLDGFDCGKPALDHWLANFARSNQSRGFTRVLVVHDDGQVVGYYGLAPSVIEPNAAPRAIRTGRPPDPIPCLLIGQLAVDRRHAGRGIGSAWRWCMDPDLSGIRSLKGHDYFVASLRRTDFGRAHASIRLRTAQPMAASVC